MECPPHNLAHNAFDLSEESSGGDYDTAAYEHRDGARELASTTLHTLHLPLRAAATMPLCGHFLSERE